MRIGLRLRGDPTDIAALAILTEFHPGIATGAWIRWSSAEGEASIISHPLMGLQGALTLVERGLSMVAWGLEGDLLRILHLGDEAGSARDRARDRARDKSADEAGDKARYEPEVDAGDEVSDEASDRAGEEARDEAGDRAGDEGRDEASDRAGDARDEAGDKARDGAGDRARDEPEVDAGDEVSDEASDRAGDEGRGEAGDRASDEARGEAGDRARYEGRGEAGDDAGSKARDKPRSEGDGARDKAARAESSAERPEERWSSPLRRQASTLLELLRPLRVPGEPQVDEALFVMRPDSGEPRLLLERLLLLGRGDALVCELELEDGTRRFAVKVQAPPVYLLMRARDGDGEDDGDGDGEDKDKGEGDSELPSGEITVYARDGERSALWVEWSYVHPLGAAAAAQLTRADQVALVDRHGTWLRGPAAWRTRSIYDALLPEIDAGAVTLTPSDAELRFAIRIRLAPGPLVDPELWLLDVDEFLELEPLIEAATGDELSRLTVARLTDGSATRYLLRERVRPGVLPLAARVSETLGVGGFARVTGADNLYLPSDRRLLPMLRRDDLRRLLGLDAAHLVILAEDRDGPRIITIPEVDEAPLQRWIDYVATDRRLALDQLLERSVFEFPEVTIEWPKKEDRLAPERPPPRERKAKRAQPRVPIASDEPEPVDTRPEPEEGARLRVLRAEARELERSLAVGGVDEPEPWERLGRLKLELDEADEGAVCLELALFHGGLPYGLELAQTLRRVHLGLAHRQEHPELLVELLVADHRTPAETSALAALLIERLAAGDSPTDEVMQLALPIFSDPRLPIPRRLAWAVLAAWHRHAGDRLGLTRAKESILGGINERGLSELHDLPRFVRYALTLDDDDDEVEVARSGDRLRQGQLMALEELWRVAEEQGLPELDAQANFVRLIFGVGFARLGARASAMEIIAPIDEEIDVHEAPNRALFRLYMARLAHEASGGSDESWALEVGRQLDAIGRRDARRAVIWLQRRSLWLCSDSEQAESRALAERSRYTLPEELELDALSERLRQEMAPESGNFDHVIADAVDACLKRALASGSEVLVAEVLGVVEPNLEGITILGHRASAIGACIGAVASLGDDAALGRLLERLVDLAQDRRLGSVKELVAAVRGGLVALRRFGGLEPARGLLEALSGVTAYTSGATIELLSTIASGLVQLGEERAAGVLLDRLVERIFDGSFDYVSRCEAGVAVAGALRHWPNVARIERCSRFVAEIEVFRDAFTTNRYFETHKIRILEAVVDSLADAQTRHGDRVQGYLDLEEHALRRRIIADWSALCGH